MCFEYMHLEHNAVTVMAYEISRSGRKWPVFPETASLNQELLTRDCSPTGMSSQDTQWNARVTTKAWVKCTANCLAGNIIIIERNDDRMNFDALIQWTFSHFTFLGASFSCRWVVEMSSPERHLQGHAECISLLSLELIPNEVTE